MNAHIRRREFLRKIGTGVIGAAVSPTILEAEETSRSIPQGVGTIRDLPTRKLGRIGIDVPILSLGSAPMGHAFYEPKPFEEVIVAALDAGIRYIDTAPIYDVAEERLGPIMAKRRSEVFLVSKTHRHTRDEVLRDIEGSLKRLQTDHVDLCHIHNLGDFTFEEVTGKGGVLEGLLGAQKRGWIKHIGCSGHLLPGRFIPVIETGAIDLIMVAMNFVDRHTYDFEEKVLPAAQRQKCAIVGMKVYGGATGGFGAYKRRAPGLLAGDEFRQQAIDYALSIPGVSTLVVGLKSLEELRLSIAAVRNHQPLKGQRREAVLAKGARIAKEWGPHFGPVT